MSSINLNTPTPDRPLGAFLRVTRLIFLFGGLLLALPAFAQTIEIVNTSTGSIVGTVVDTTEDPIPDATVVLQGPAGDRFAAVTKNDGSFAFHDVRAGIAYQATVTAEGFTQWNSSVTVDPGRENTLNSVKLRILTVQRAVTVSYSEKEVAAQEFRAEEQQRILHFIPNTYVTYEPHPEPLTTEMKYHLAYKSLTDPVFFARTGAWAGVQQAIVVIQPFERWWMGASALGPSGRRPDPPGSRLSVQSRSVVVVAASLRAREHRGRDDQPRASARRHRPARGAARRAHRGAVGGDRRQTVVLVTHSMGGLASRAYLRRHGATRVAGW